MNSVKTELEAEKLLDNMDLTLDEDETENQSSDDLALTPPEHDVFEDASLYDARITEEAFTLPETTLYIRMVFSKEYIRRMDNLTGRKYITSLLYHTSSFLQLNRVRALKQQRLTPDIQAFAFLITI